MGHCGHSLVPFFLEKDARGAKTFSPQVSNCQSDYDEKETHVLSMTGVSHSTLEPCVLPVLPGEAADNSASFAKMCLWFCVGI